MVDGTVTYRAWITAVQTIFWHPLWAWWMLFTDGSIKASEGSTIVLCLDDDVQVLKCQQQQQQFITVTEYGQHNLPCRWLGHECSYLMAKKWCIFPLQSSNSTTGYEWQHHNLLPAAVCHKTPGSTTNIWAILINPAPCDRPFNQSTHCTPCQDPRWTTVHSTIGSYGRCFVCAQVLYMHSPPVRVKLHECPMPLLHHSLWYSHSHIKHISFHTFGWLPSATKKQRTTLWSCLDRFCIWHTST